MNKGDSIEYDKGNTAEKTRAKFSSYLTDSSKWNIEAGESELKQLAEEASHFVPRVFMTAGKIAFAIQCKAYDFTDEELYDEDKNKLYKRYKEFEDNICGRRKFTNYYLSRYCDIPNYRKDEIEAEFQEALEAGNYVRATELQCGLVSVESAIKDYIKRYAYPIKVRGLLDTFEAILEDVNGFTEGVLADLSQAKKELGEKNSERKEVSEKKGSANEKIAALENTKGKIDEQLAVLDDIEFDSNALKIAITDLRADIEEDANMKFIRANPKVMTGRKSHSDVENEIESTIAKITDLFDRTLQTTNQKLEEIKRVYDGQLLEIFDKVKLVVKELENAGVFKQGEYKFTDSVMWRMNFANINSDSFASKLKKSVVDYSNKKEQVLNEKKIDWEISDNPLKKFGALFMKDYKMKMVERDGYYETTDLTKEIDAYYIKLAEQSTKMENSFTNIMKDSKMQVRNLTTRLLSENKQFLEDVKNQEKRIAEIGNSIDDLNREIEEKQAICAWLNELSEMLKGEK
jgi:hypothetical protein